MPPDAIAWIVSDFQRQALEPSSTYQVAGAPSPHPFVRVTKAPTDSYIFRSDKRPIKNIITTALTKPLTSVTGKNFTNGNGHGVHGEHDGHGEHEMNTAPSYTFYASEKILNGSSFVLNTSRDVLEYLQDWLNVKYPFPKLGKPTGFCSSRSN